MFASNRAFNADSKSSRCLGDNSFLLVFMVLTVWTASVSRFHSGRIPTGFNHSAVGADEVGQAVDVYAKIVEEDASVRADHFFKVLDNPPPKSIKAILKLLSEPSILDE